ncbi:protein kinase [Kiritimatiellota bacterium B12222]|nr:protein kinase [Kiritimatiellota bacterium B12222]
MSVKCDACGKELQGRSKAETCPFCGYLTRGAPPLSTLVPENSFERGMTPDESGLPTISAIESGDDAYLKKGVMTPPNRPGIRGNLGRFELLKLLGRGGMGLVYLAREPMTDTQVAVKVLRQELAEHPKVIRYFMSEARHMYAMSHPNILKVLEVSESDRGPFFVMPYIRGGSLRDRLQDQVPLSSAEITSIGSQVAKGLVYAHSRGLLHRDLKPDNVLIDDQHLVMITDFGLVRSFLDDTLRDVSESAAEGTPAYMSPSVAAGQAEDTRCDIYSFGAMMYEMLTGKLPYNGATADKILDAIRTGPPPSIHKINSDANKDLTKITEAAMARELRDRYATMADVLEDLERVSKGQRPLGPYTQAARRKFPVSIRMMLPIVLLLLIGVVGVMSNTSKEVEAKSSVQVVPPVGPSLLPTALPTPTIEMTYEQGVEAFESKEYDVAIEAFKEVVILDPEDYEAWLKLGDAYLALGNTLSARISYGKVLRIRGNNIEALMGLSKAFQLEGQRHYYTLYMNKAFNADPTNDEIENKLMSELIEIGHVNPAKGTLRVLKQFDPDDPSIPLWEAKISELENNTKEQGIAP